MKIPLSASMNLSFLAVWLLVTGCAVLTVTLVVRDHRDSLSSSNGDGSLSSSNNDGPPSASPNEVNSASPTTSYFEPPTSSYVEPNPVPMNPPRGYFNYDVDDMVYGPSKWHRVDTSQHPLIEFGPKGFGPWKGHLPYQPSQNLCGSRDRKQSPKDMVRSVECDAHHEIRTYVSRESYLF